MEINGYIFYIKVTWELFLEVNTRVIDKKEAIDVWASNVSQSSCSKDSVFSNNCYSKRMEVNTAKASGDENFYTKNDLVDNYDVNGLDEWFLGPLCS